MTATTETTTTRTCPPSAVSPWQALRDYHAAEMRRYTEACEGFTVEQVVAPAIAISIWQAHKTALARMDELETAVAAANALAAAAFDEAAADRDERAADARCHDRIEEQREHNERAAQYRAKRDELEAGQ